jgi:hypothetical protein
MKAVINALTIAGANISNNQHDKFEISVGYESDFNEDPETTFGRYYRKKKKNTGDIRSKYGVLIILPNAKISRLDVSQGGEISYDFSAYFWAAENTSQTAPINSDVVDVERLSDLEARMIQMLGDTQRILQYTGAGDLDFEKGAALNYYRRSQDTQMRYVILVNFSASEIFTYDCGVLPIFSIKDAQNAILKEPLDNSVPTIGGTIYTAMQANRDLTQLSDKEV